MQRRMWLALVALIALAIGNGVLAHAARRVDTTAFVDPFAVDTDNDLVACVPDVSAPAVALVAFDAPLPHLRVACDASACILAIAPKTSPPTA